MKGVPMGNVNYKECGNVCYGILKDGTTFLIDKENKKLIENINWYRSTNDPKKIVYISTRYGELLHTFLIDYEKGYEVDHINLDTLDNRMCNLRVVSHQQNQINQPLQRNNTSGVTGVSYYKARKKYRARIKISQLDVHLGYYETFLEAVQARNIGMSCMFGEYGRYNDVPLAPKWIINKVVSKCKQWSNLSVNEDFKNDGDIKSELIKCA